MGEWDVEAVRRLFISLEFRTLLDRLEEVGRSAKPSVEVAELDLREAPLDEVARSSPRTRRRPCGSSSTAARCTGWPCRSAGARPRTLRSDRSRGSRGSSRTSCRSGCTTRRTSRRPRSRAEGRVGGVRFDTMLARVPAGPGDAELRPPGPVRAVPRDGRRRLGRGGGRGPALRRVLARVRRRGRRDRAAGTGHGRADREGRHAAAARRGRAAAVVGPRAHAGTGRGARRRVPRRDGDRHPDRDGRAAGRRSSSTRGRSST